MKKPLLFLALLAFIGVSCFAEVKVKRIRIPDTNVNITVHWNSSYCSEPDEETMEELMEEFSNDAKEMEEELGANDILMSYFIIGNIENDTFYATILADTKSFGTLLFVMFGQGDFTETIYYDIFYNYNSAKREYDRYCAKYKEYVKDNYIDR